MPIKQASAEFWIAVKYWTDRTQR